MKSKPKIAVIGAKGFPAWGGAARSNEEIFTRLKDKYDVTVYALSSHASVLCFHKTDSHFSTSIFEGTSNTIMEAMSYSLPDVATNVGDDNRLVIEGETGFLTQPKDVSALADRLEQLILSPEKRNSMGAKGYQHIKENYSVDKFQQRYFELIESLLNEKKA